jgi:hypothetical protein
VSREMARRGGEGGSEGAHATAGSGEGCPGRVERAVFGPGRRGPMTRGTRHIAGGFKTRSNLIQTDSKIFKLI